MVIQPTWAAGPVVKALRPLLGLISLLLVVAGFGLWAFQAPPPPDKPLQIGGDFTLISGAGEVVDTAVAFAGRPMLVTFGYTTCPDMCPTSLLDMVMAAEQTAVDEAVVFISIDPARDTPAVLAAFTALFSDELTGFTGSSAAVEAVKSEWAVYAARHDEAAFTDYLMDHTTLIFLTDADHRVVESFRSGVGADALAQAISARLFSPMG